MKHEILVYTEHDPETGAVFMPKKRLITSNGTTFGERLVLLRKKVGYTQRELAAEVGISHRMIAYYEGETDYPPTHLLPAFAKALGVSADELLGLEPLKNNKGVSDSRLWRRLKRAATLPAQERKQVLHFIDALSEREKLKTQSTQQAA